MSLTVSLGTVLTVAQPYPYRTTALSLQELLRSFLLPLLCSERGSSLDLLVGGRFGMRRRVAGTEVRRA